MTLAEALTQWALVEADFQSHYSIDLDRSRDRSWRWFRVRLWGLLSAPETRLWRHFAPSEEEDPADPTDDLTSEGDGRGE